MPSSLSRVLRVLIAPALLVGAVLGATPAQAASKKIIAGAVCGLWDTAFRNQVAYNHGIIHFAEGSAVPVSCPLVRSNTGNTNGLLDLEVRFRNIHGDHVIIACTAFSMRADGTVQKSVRREVFATSGKLDFGGSLNQSESAGSYSVFCDLPAHTLLYSLYMSEP